MPPTARRQREVLARERHLLDVARGMLIAQGYSGLSMDRLAEATEYSKGTVYGHFANKEDLVMALASQTMKQRSSLFERVARYRGRAREKIEGIGIADELFARLYPHSFRSELIIKMADLEDQASSDRRESLRLEEGRCLRPILGFIEEAVEAGDLPRSTPVPQVLFAIMTMAIGTHTVVSNFRPILAEVRVDDPFGALRANVRVLLDGFGWKPLATEWDYDATYRRIKQEIFADECQTVGLG